VPAYGAPTYGGNVIADHQDSPAYGAPADSYSGSSSGFGGPGPMMPRGRFSPQAPIMEAQPGADDQSADGSPIAEDAATATAGDDSSADQGADQGPSNADEQT